jgi:hypothetical protein
VVIKTASALLPLAVLIFEPAKFEHQIRMFYLTDDKIALQFLYHWWEIFLQLRFPEPRPDVPIFFLWC